MIKYQQIFVHHLQFTDYFVHYKYCQDVVILILISPERFNKAFFLYTSQNFKSLYFSFIIRISFDLWLCVVFAGEVFLWRNSWSETCELTTYPILRMCDAVCGGVKALRLRISSAYLTNQNTARKHVPRHQSCDGGVQSKTGAC